MKNRTSANPNLFIRSTIDRECNVLHASFQIYECRHSHGPANIYHNIPINRGKKRKLRLPQSLVFFPYIPYCYLRHFTADLRKLFTIPFTVYYFLMFFPIPIKTRIVDS